MTASPDRDVVEKVARAIFGATHVALTWDGLLLNEKSTYVRQARAALAAITAAPPRPEDAGFCAGVIELVNEQANDDGLWFVAQTAAEAYLQQELRRLHEAIEGKTSAECAIRALSPRPTADGSDQDAAGVVELAELVAAVKHQSNGQTRAALCNYVIDNIDKLTVVGAK